MSVDVKAKIAEARAKSTPTLVRNADKASLAHVAAIKPLSDQLRTANVGQHRARLAELGLGSLDPSTLLRIGAGIVAAVADIADPIERDSTKARIRALQDHAW